MNAQSLYALHSNIFMFGLMVVILVFIWLLVSRARNWQYGSITKALMLVFSAITAVEWLIGISVVAARGESAIAIWVHAAIMSIAMIASFLHLRWSKQQDGVRYRRAIVLMLTVASLVATAIILLYVL